MMFDPEKEITRVKLGRPTLTYKGPIGSQRDASELLSILEQMLHKGSRVLDLGCGPRDQAEPISFLGFEYVGIDLVSPNADILADAHALPFASASMDGVFSFAVLEHLSNPSAAFDEIKRVLRPGGIYCGTVSQGEPFTIHYFTTPLGASQFGPASGLEALRLWACGNTLTGLADRQTWAAILVWLEQAYAFWIIFTVGCQSWRREK